MGEDRQPYGSPERLLQAKKQFPEKNLHYMHHDSVMPHRELLKLYYDFYQKNDLSRDNSPHG